MASAGPFKPGPPGGNSAAKVANPKAKQPKRKEGKPKHGVGTKAAAAGEAIQNQRKQKKKQKAKQAAAGARPMEGIELRVHEQEAEDAARKEKDVKGKQKAAEETGVVETKGVKCHEMRITSQGSINSYVAFALKHLMKAKSVPLCLHTLPLDPSGAPTASKPPTNAPATDKTAEQQAPAAHAGAAAPDAGDVDGGPKKKRPKPTAVDKLISLVEIIKREYAVAVQSAKKPAPADGEGDASSLHAEGKEAKAKDAAERKGKAAAPPMTMPEPPVAIGKKRKRPVDETDNNTEDFATPTAENADAHADGAAGTRQGGAASRLPNRLHQYNELGYLESLPWYIASTANTAGLNAAREGGPEGAEEDFVTLAKHAAVVEGLVHQGRKRPRLSHTPYMRIFIARHPITALKNHKDFTYQPPPRQRKRGGKKARARKEGKTASGVVSEDNGSEGEEQDEGDEMDIAPV